LPAPLVHLPSSFLAKRDDPSLHPRQQLLGGQGRNASQLEFSDFFALPLDLAAHLAQLISNRDQVH
jgi:hypothetical protein